MKSLRSFIYKNSVNIVGYLYRLAEFFLAIVAFYFIYKYLLDQVLDGSNIVYPLLAAWLLTAYFTLPKIHRFLTNRYLPNYYVGRARSGSGLLADPINLVFFAEEDQLHDAMEAANWQIADPLTAKSLLQTIAATLFHKSYPNAPVGNMYLFGRKYDFAYQKQVGGSPKVRHHVRFWKTPEGWRLPGGHRAEWLAAATYDEGVGVKLFTLQIDHMISTDIDNERDYVIKTLEDAGAVKEIEIIEHFTDAYHDHNNGGDTIKTDGALPFLQIQSLE